MKGLLPFILVVLIMLALAILLGACCIGTFIAPVLWMKIVCFVVSNMFAVGVTVILCALAGTVKDKSNNKQ